MVVCACVVFNTLKRLTGQRVWRSYITIYNNKLQVSITCTNCHVGKLNEFKQKIAQCVMFITCVF